MGGGIINIKGALTITNGTISGNRADGLGGGLRVLSGTVMLRNTIIANSLSGGDCNINDGIIIDGGYNLIEDNSCGFTGGADPLLGPLQDNGGPTLTQALLPGSPAIDAGNPSGCMDNSGIILPFDQRGFFRAIDGNGNGSAICDIGAYEFGSAAPLASIYLPLILR